MKKYLNCLLAFMRINFEAGHYLATNCGNVETIMQNLAELS